MISCTECKELQRKNEITCKLCKKTLRDDVDNYSPKAFRRGYVAALFMEDEDWIKRIEKYHLIVPGSPLSAKIQKRNTAEIECLREQISAETYNDRKAYYTAWRNDPCCADECDRYCDECNNDRIEFKPIPTYGLDPDVRRFITKYGRYQMASELITEEWRRFNAGNQKTKPSPVLSGVRDGESHNDPVWNRGQEGDGLFSQPEEVPSDQAERVEAMLSHPIGEEMVT